MATLHLLVTSPSGSTVATGGEGGVPGTAGGLVPAGLLGGDVSGGLNGGLLLDGGLVAGGVLAGEGLLDGGAEGPPERLMLQACRMELLQVVGGKAGQWATIRHARNSCNMTAAGRAAPRCKPAGRQQQEHVVC